MNLDNANRHIRAVIEEALDENTAAIVLAEQSFIDRHTDALLHQVSLADPNATNFDAAETAAAEYAATVRNELKQQHPDAYRDDD